MSITGELREYADRLSNSRHPWSGIARDLSSIADRIDIAHKHAIGYVDDRDPETMAENGWVKLPVSEDGNVLYIGDLVDEKLPFGGYAAPAPIDTMELSRGASGYGWMVKLDAENRAFINPKLLRHHRIPTVEDVLREFADRVCNSGHQWGLDADTTIAEYAAKLQLKED